MYFELRKYSKRPVRHAQADQMALTINRAIEVVDKILENTANEFDQDAFYSPDLLSKLERLASQITDTTTKEKLVRWENEGLRQLQIVQQNNSDDLYKLCKSSLSFLAKYLNLQHGNVYVYQDYILKRCAAYATHSNTSDDIEFELGEGLVGACFQDKKNIVLTHEQAAVFTITSGLGACNPSFIVLSPLIFQEITLGVLEVASIEVFQPKYVQFLEKAAGSIAAYVHVMLAQENTKRLLEESQLVAKKLMIQEEELKQNMEELAATQEQLKEKDILNTKEIERLRAEYEAILAREKAQNEALQAAKNSLLVELTSNNIVVDLAGRQRMLSQKMAYLAERIIGGSSHLCQEFKNLIDQHDQVLRSLHFGGVLKNGSESVVLKQAPDNVFPYTKAAYLHWEYYSMLLKRILEADFSAQNRNEIEKASQKMLELNNAVVGAYSRHYKNKILSEYA